MRLAVWMRFSLNNKRHFYWQYKSGLELQRQVCQQACFARKPVQVYKTQGPG